MIPRFARHFRAWWASATYLGIAIAPLLGAGVLGVNPQLVPVVGAVLALAAIVVFLIGFRGHHLGSRYAAEPLLDQQDANNLVP